MAIATHLLATRPVPTARLAPAVRWLSGAVFVLFGIGKFTAHANEVASFGDYGLPAPDVFVYAIGVFEVVGGMLLLAGLATRLRW